MGSYLNSWHRPEDGPCVRCYAWRLIEAVVVGLLLAALAFAWSEQHVALWPDRPTDSAVPVPVSQTARDLACPDGGGVDAMEADHHGGAVATAC